jgi:hypothetical protein
MASYLFATRVACYTLSNLISDSPQLKPSSRLISVCLSSRPLLFIFPLRPQHFLDTFVLVPDWGICPERWPRSR